MMLKRIIMTGLGGLLVLPLAGRAEVMLQYFNISWKELADKMPELAEVGYGALWLPPPTKGSGGLSVGYDLWDPFDIGSKDQRGSVSTRYGTEGDLLRMVEIAHRFGIKVYWDNIMNHRAFDIPGYNENTPIDIYPGMVPEDFHLRVTEDGFYRKWDNTRDWNDAWQVQNLGLSDLIDIAHENPNTNFGSNEGDDHPKIVFVRQPNNPEYYLDTDLPFSVSNPGGSFNVYTFANKEPYQDVGYGVGNTGAGNGKFDWDDVNANGQHDAGESSEPFTDTGLDPNRVGWQNAAHGYGDGKYNMGNPVAEDVNALLIRAARWLMDRTYADGLRLDAVKHVPDYFFGTQFGGDKDYSGAGYTGGAQFQFNLTRGFSDWNNNRDSFFNLGQARDDAMMFGEHLGSPPAFGGYIDAGMRLKDAPLRDKLNGILGQPWGDLSGLDQPNGGSDFGAGVQFANSHDSDYSSARELQHAFYCTRDGYPNIYTDGNYKAETLGQSGGAFPRHANTRFLGQFGDSRLPNAVYLNEHMARGYQQPRWADNDVVAYERVDKRENGGMPDSDGVVMVFMMNDNFSAGQYREISTSFAAGSKLWQYASGGGGFYATVAGDGKIKTIIPPGGYFAFGWRSPEPSDLWSGFGGKPITFYENGQLAGTMSYVRKDGPDGDPNFNPYGVADTNANDYSYTMTIPRVTSATNLRFVARVDGSASDVKFKLNGGVDLNSQMGISGYGGDTFFKRDNPPGINDPLQGSDLFIGYEGARFVHRQYREKFAARNTTSNNVIGSAGAETYIAFIGTSTNFTINTGETGRDSDQETASWVYHDPSQTITASGQPAFKQFHPAPLSAANSNITLWIKVGYACNVSRGFIYYTTDGQTFPEGAGGEAGNAKTKVAVLNFAAADSGDGSIDWWKATIPALTNGTVLRYKAGLYKQQGWGCDTDDWVIPFPNSDFDIGRKKSFMGVWEITNFNARTSVYAIHNDYGTYRTGLVEGFNFLQARAFLERANRASIYNTFKQTFYFDASTPTGQVIFPANDFDTLGSQEYGAVVRTDPTVREVWFNLRDVNGGNDDGSTGGSNGNGTNAAGQEAWVQATRVTPSSTIVSPYPEEWRFTYRNIPSSGNVTMQVRLVEWTSSTNFNLSDADGHFTTLRRLAVAAAPTQAVFVAFPPNDGDTVDSNYVMKVYFSNSLADGVSSNDLKNRFLIRINGSAQNKDDYQIIYSNQSGQFHELAFRLPNMYNGQANFLHNIEITHTKPGGVVLQASRLVKAAPAAVGPYVSIIDPLEFDLNGTPQVITLNDIPSPPPEDRSYTIQVETDLAASNVWIAFLNNAGSAGKLPAIETMLPGLVNVANGSTNATGIEKTLSGTVSVTASNQTVTGAGTFFTTQLQAGNTIRISTNLVTVTQIVSATSATLSEPYPGGTASGVTAFQLPAFDGSLAGGNTLKISNNLLIVGQVLSSSNVTFAPAYPGATLTGGFAHRVDPNPAVNGNRKVWQFLWTNMTAGVFTFTASVDTDGDTNSVEALDSATITVILRQLVDVNLSDFDDDDDGIYDTDEITSTDLPDSLSETWNNGDVHVWQIYGRSDPLSPDTDGDGLHDGLELGWSVPIDPAMTLTNTDTNGDGWKNFLPDLDPPFYNTVPDNGCVPGYNFNAGRTILLRGGITDPSNPDTDGDGIWDGIEDWNRNGWVDGDGSPLPPGSDKCSRGSWPDGQWDTAWTETDPNKGDTDGDGLSDGYGEDTDFSGWIAGDVNSNRIWEAGELWTETNPLRPDTDGDGLPDGWEVQYGFDALDIGIIGYTNMRTGLIITNTLNGAAGNPDGDVIVVGGVTNEYSNLLEFQNGTNPRFADTGSGPPAGSITIGRGPVIGVLGGVTNYQEFLDWTWDDLILLDEYEGNGFNNQGGDLYLGYDGFDSSRDMVAFYARDGGDIGLGGDGNFYFRVDFHDLQAFAEDGSLNIYVVIDTGNPAAGESALPDEVDFRTSNRWEAVVFVDKGNTGKVYIDTDPNNNSSTINAPLASFGVISRDQNADDGFGFAYFNSELDAVEFSISRQAMIDAGWNGIDADDLNYQVFTTKDGNCNSCNNGSAGAGDIGGRNDIRDTFYDDYMAEDYYASQAGIPGTLNSHFSGGLKAGRAKVSSIIHGNQHVQPGNVIQNYINNGQGGGYFRPLAAHELYRQPFNLHITPTLASAIEWARVDTNQSPAFRDGPSFNDWVASLIATNVAYLMASTFSDNMMPYFTPEFVQDNDALARQFLNEIYGATITSNNVFWTPERLADDDVLHKIRNVLGYRATVLDQMEHYFTWFGRSAALGDDGYRINRINEVETFAINNGASDFRFSTDDNGLDMSLRALFNRKARGAQDQVVTWFGNWEEYANNAKSDAYDRNIRWIANHPWIQMVALEQILRGQVDASADGIPDNWFQVNRGTAARPKTAQNYVNYASQGNYDNWYLGSFQEEGLFNKYFQIRPGTNVNDRYGMMYFDGIITNTWDEVNVTANSNLLFLARSVLHASVFQTAFHNQPNVDLRKFSIGTYIYPDGSSNTLASFAAYPQSQTRMAAMYERVDDWASTAGSVTTPQALAEDIDLDGENEYLLYNDRIFGVLERAGGRLVAAWVRDILDGTVYQALGNQVGYSGSATEWEGTFSADGSGNVNAFRTSGLKDWYTPKGGGTNYVNSTYSFVNWTNGWRMTSADGQIVKTVTLGAKHWAFRVHYQMTGAMTNQVLYVRNGFSPNLGDLLLRGQQTLGPVQNAGGIVSVLNTNYGTTVSAFVQYNGDGHNTGYNPLATDENDSAPFFTYTMRNQAQTHQVELLGTNNFSFALGFQARPSDWDGDGIPNVYEDGLAFLDSANPADGTADEDTDFVSNADEYIMGTDPDDVEDYLRATQHRASPTGIVVRFPTVMNREYFIKYGSSLINPNWSAANTNGIPGTGGVVEWIDDGTLTSPAPQDATNRNYRIDVSLPQ